MMKQCECRWSQDMGLREIRWRVTGTEVYVEKYLDKYIITIKHQFLQDIFVSIVFRIMHQFFTCD